MQRSAARRERAFSIIEVVIAALLLAIVIAAATAVFAGSTQSGAAMRVKDRQTALANQLLSKLQADPTWATHCKAQADPNQCNISPWIAQRGYNQLGRITDASGTTEFRVEAQARGLDLPADLQGADDKDGVVPDVYRIQVTVGPSADLANRYSGLRPVTIRAELNPQVRMVSGRVTVDACRAENQIDERMPIADCYATSSWADLLPPPTLDTTTDQRIRQTCDGPQGSRGGDNRDCIAFKCADTEIASMRSRGASCESYPGWKPPNQWPAHVHSFSRVRMVPVQGSVRLRHVESGTVYGPQPFNAGRAQFKNLPVGDYEVLPTVSGGDRLWRSKSVPSTGIVTVEAGLNSRAVLVYRPLATGAISIPVNSVDRSIPWAPVPYPGWVDIDDNGVITEGTQPVEVCLVPVPKGRLLTSDVPCIQVPRSSSTTEFRFENVEPGLYAVELSKGGYTRFMDLDGTAGFMFIPETGPPTTSLTGTQIEYVEGLCAQNVRETVVGATWDPVENKPISPVEPCSSPGGASPPGGSGGGGWQ